MRKDKRFDQTQKQDPAVDEGRLASHVIRIWSGIGDCCHILPHCPRKSSHPMNVGCRPGKRRAETEVLVPAGPKIAVTAERTSMITA
jgi:hypothetical protein